MSEAAPKCSEDSLEKVDSLIKELLETFQTIAIPTIDMIRGQADALDIDFPTFLKYAVGLFKLVVLQR